MLIKGYFNVSVTVVEATARWFRILGETWMALCSDSLRLRWAIWLTYLLQGGSIGVLVASLLLLWFVYFV